jgi:glycosyltransferase involved in cell wall biosynthesis
VSDGSLAAHYASADVYLSLSEHEGFGVPLVEAMTAGVPIVARGAGAVPETTGGAAVLLEAADPSYVAAVLQRVCTDGRLRAVLVAEGKRRAAELSSHATASHIVDLITEAVRP